MKELIGHIESLLLTHDCVIVPDFGGFIAFNIPARWVEGKSTFTPPVRTVGFNPQLRLNDGLVVQAYMSAYGTNFPDASKRVHKATRELKSHLMNQGLIELQGLGTLRVSMDGSYHFVPFVDGLNSPALYGLGRLDFPLLPGQQAATHTEQESTPLTRKISKEPQPPHEMELESPSSGRILRRIAAVSAAAVALFLTLSIPVGNVDDVAYQRAQVVTPDLFAKQTPVHGVKKTPLIILPTTDLSDLDTRTEHTEMTEPDFSPATPDVSAEKETAPVKETVNPDTYFIVVGAFSKEHIAEEMVSTLRKKGYPKATVLPNSRIHKVCIASYPKEEEAITALRKFRGGMYEDAWIFKKK